jgi:hypothetical protein
VTPELSAHASRGVVDAGEVRVCSEVEGEVAGRADGGLKRCREGTGVFVSLFSLSLIRLKRQRVEGEREETKGR